MKEVYRQTDGQTDEQTKIGWSEKLTWTLGSGELKLQTYKIAYFVLYWLSAFLRQSFGNREVELLRHLGKLVCTKRWYESQW